MDDSARIIVEALESEILRLQADTKLPSESELMHTFGATRHVVRKALGQLEAQFLVRRVKGSGTFVNGRLDYVVSSRVPPSLHETFARVGGVLRTFVLDASAHPVPADVAHWMAPVVGDRSLRLIRLGYLDDELVNYGDVWVSPRVLPELDVRLRAYESLTELLRATGADPVRRWTRVIPDLTPAAMLEHLPINEPVPAWRFESFVDDSATGEPLMFSHGWMRQDRVTISIEYENTTVDRGTCCASSESVHNNSRGDWRRCWRTADIGGDPGAGTRHAVCGASTSQDG